ncbi:MAG TPA: AAA family ATPase [Proteobacteria bacterium]|nr:archaeal ATPase [bacterium BMS3Abin14]HDL52457.1 AAA family ATPase [Pseudomonadota bacterium]
MSYLDFFRLHTEPFNNAPNERFYYNSAQHARALTRIMYVAETMKGFAVVVGDIGTGKTTLARKVLDSLPDEAYESALLIILHGEVSPEWLLRRVAGQLGVEQPGNDKIQIIGQLYRRLLQLHQMGKKAVVLIDEAQMLSSKQIMEEFRGLLNLEVTAHKLVTFIFFGLPELEHNLALDPPLLQRVAMKIRLSTLSEDATKAYIAHRLAIAGNRDELFTDNAVARVYSCSGGFPRKINILCDNALFQGFLMRRRIVDAAIVDEMALDLGFAPQPLLEQAVPSVDLSPDWVPGDEVVSLDEGISPNPVAGDPDEEDIDARFDEFFTETFEGDK